MLAILQRDEPTRESRVRKAPLNLDSEPHFAFNDVRQGSIGNEEFRSSLEDLINGVAPPMSVASEDNDTTHFSETQLDHTQSLLREAEHNNSKLEEQVAVLKDEVRRFLF